jgi:hypothetical protein
MERRQIGPVRLWMRGDGSGWRARCSLCRWTSYLPGISGDYIWNVEQRAKQHIQGSRNHGRRKGERRSGARVTRSVTLLYLDMDGPTLPVTLVGRTVSCCWHLWGWHLQGMRIDRTQHGYHVVVQVHERLAPAIIVAAQAILGSDVKREAFNLMRVQHLLVRSPFWRRRWNVLYAVHRKSVQPRWRAV